MLSNWYVYIHHVESCFARQFECIILFDDCVFVRFFTNFLILIKCNSVCFIAFLLPIPKVPPKIMPIQSMTNMLKEGMRAAISCQILEGDLPVTFRWERNGKSIIGTGYAWEFSKFLFRCLSFLFFILICVWFSICWNNTIFLFEIALKSYDESMNIRHHWWSSTFYRTILEIIRVLVSEKHSKMLRQNLSSLVQRFNAFEICL